MAFLPSRAITLIREYSKPLTRPDWRRIKKLSNYDLYTIIKNVTMSNVNLVLIIQRSMIHTLWYKLFGFIRIMGLEKTCVCHNILKEELMKIVGINEAIAQYETVKCHMKREYGFIG